MRPPSSIRSVASVSMRSRNAGERAPWSARKLRKSHCGISAMNLQRVGRWVKSAIVTLASPMTARTSGALRVRKLQELLEQSKLVHHLERGGMNGVAAKIAQEIGVLLQHDDLDAGARQQVAQHHPGRAAAGDGAGRANRLIHARRPYPSPEDLTGLIVRPRWLVDPSPCRRPFHPCCGIGSSSTLGRRGGAPSDQGGTPATDTRRLDVRFHFCWLFPQPNPGVNHPLTINWANFAGETLRPFTRQAGTIWTPALFLSHG